MTRGFGVTTCRPEELPGDELVYCHNVLRFCLVRQPRVATSCSVRESHISYIERTCCVCLLIRRATYARDASCMMTYSQVMASGLSCRESV